jgi:hypothetical protein
VVCGAGRDYVGKRSTRVSGQLAWVITSTKQHVGQSSGLAVIYGQSLNCRTGAIQPLSLANSTQITHPPLPDLRTEDVNSGDAERRYVAVFPDRGAGFGRAGRPCLLPERGSSASGVVCSRLAGRGRAPAWAAAGGIPRLRRLRCWLAGPLSVAIGLR